MGGVKGSSGLESDGGQAGVHALDLLEGRLLHLGEAEGGGERSRDDELTVCKGGGRRTEDELRVGRGERVKGHSTGRKDFSQTASQTVDGPSTQGNRTLVSTPR